MVIDRADGTTARAHPLQCYLTFNGEVIDPARVRLTIFPAA